MRNQLIIVICILLLVSHIVVYILGRSHAPVVEETENSIGFYDELFELGDISNKTGDPFSDFLFYYSNQGETHEESNKKKR